MSGTAQPVQVCAAGDQVLEETDDSGQMLARYTTASGSYYQPWVHMQRAGGISRFPLYDGVGSVRRLVDPSNNHTDNYELIAFGVDRGGWTTTQNPYRFGGAWGYITDTPGSGLLQLGERFYWPEIGRFIQQDPVGDGTNWYGYVANNPMRYTDPEGLWGAGVSGSETTDIGVGLIGAGQTGAAGIGVFGKGLGGLHLGGLAGWGGFAGGTAGVPGRGWGRGWPSSPSEGRLAVGAFAGGGANVWLTNATNARQLAGVSVTRNINVGWHARVFSLQVSQGNGIWVLSYGGAPLPGVAWGAAASCYNTYGKTAATTWSRVKQWLKGWSRRLMGR